LQREKDQLQREKDQLQRERPVTEIYQRN
jgi:hypothetical protein